MDKSSRSNAGTSSKSEGREPPINAPTPPNMVTPSSMAKSKWNDAVEQLPSEDMQAVARTYTNRLHQLRLQREKHHGTHERHTKPGFALPASCMIKFELGASAAIREKPAYASLKEKVEETIESAQIVLKDAIVELQVLEMQAKEEEIRKTFCEGLCKIALSVINYHRDNGAKIDKTMQSFRLADRLVEMLMEQHADLLEHSFLLEGPVANKIPQYYQLVGRDRPTHAAKQNRNNRSSPYNPHHTKLLGGMLEEYKNIVDPCFHSSWKEYLVALSKLQGQQQHQMLKQQSTRNVLMDGSKHNNSNKAENGASTTNKKYSRKSVSAPAPAPAPEVQLPTAEALKEMVQSAISQETQALNAKLKQLEEQLKKGPTQTVESNAPAPATSAAPAPATTPGANNKGGKKKNNKKNKKNNKNNNAAANSNEDKKEEATGNQQQQADTKAEAPAPAAAPKKEEAAAISSSSESPAATASTNANSAEVAKNEQATNNNGAISKNKKKRNNKKNKNKANGPNNNNAEQSKPEAAPAKPAEANGGETKNNSGSVDMPKEDNNGKKEDSDANGAKQDEAKNNNAATTSAKKEGEATKPQPNGEKGGETMNGDSNGNKKAESYAAKAANQGKPSDTKDTNGNTNGSGTAGTTTQNDSENDRDGKPVAQKRDSTTVMFGSFETTGAKEWS